MSIPCGASFHFTFSVHSFHLNERLPSSILLSLLKVEKKRCDEALNMADQGAAILVSVRRIKIVFQLCLLKYLNMLKSTWIIKINRTRYLKHIRGFQAKFRQTSACWKVYFGEKNQINGK